ncbi:hypothetical protein GF351_00035 [Candidatus Woesearchaeota archaeon]|nr:hypothetical protein [Candidatus Woesearchaeota archaeon]
MIPYRSFISWNIGPVTIQSWGLMVAVAFITATVLAAREADKRGMDGGQIYSMMIWILSGSFIFSRLSYVIPEWHLFSQDPVSIFYIWQGGLTFLGGLAGAIIAVIIYLRIHKLDFWKYADVVAIYLPLAHALGRVGCILGDGGHLGKVTSMPWGVVLEGTSEARHLTSAYAVIYLLVIFGLMLYLKRKEHYKGFLFSAYLFMYSIARFISDFVRISEVYILGLTGSQWVSIGLLLFSCTYFWMHRKDHRDHKGARS